MGLMGDIVKNKHAVVNGRGDEATRGRGDEAASAAVAKTRSVSIEVTESCQSAGIIPP